MARVTVRVAPRSGRTAVEAGPNGIVIRVRSAPEGGMATEEARRALADAVAVAPGAVRLSSGSRSRTKVFEVGGLEDEELERRLRDG